MTQPNGRTHRAEARRAGPGRTARPRTTPEGGHSRRVLLLHGLGCSTSTWDRLAGRMPDDVELLDVELPWHGVGDTSWYLSQDSVGQLVDAIGPEGLAGVDAVVAHSFSANLLLEAYLDGRLPERPSVFAAPFYRPEVKDFDWATISYYLNDFHLIFDEALRVAQTGERRPGDRPAMARVLRDHCGPYGWIRFFESYLRSPLLRPEAAGARHLVLVGSDDIAAEPAGARALAERLPGAGFALVEGSGHFPMLDDPDRFAAAVTGFLATLPEGTAPDRFDHPTTHARS